MRPGRELDALVAEHVMGIKVIRSPKFKDPCIAEKRHLRNLPWVMCSVEPYSTDIAAAWEVVEKFEYRTIVFRHDVKLWGVELSLEWADPRDEHYPHNDPFYGDGLTAPHAICLAALKAVGYEFKEDK